jgi:hypothetical protein
MSMKLKSSMGAPGRLFRHRLTIAWKMDGAIP